MKKHLILGAVLVALLAFIIIGCPLLSVSISQRVSDFVTDLNKSSDRNLSDNFHSDMPPDLYNDDTTFDVTQLGISRQPFTISLIGSAQDLGGGVKYQAGTLTNNTVGSPYTIEFNFQEEDPGVWYILAMRVGGFTWGTMVE